MKVICIDASPGFISGELPPFKEGEVLNVMQSPYHIEDYRILSYRNDIRGWHKKRFIPLSNIDETQLVNQREFKLEEA